MTAAGSVYGQALYDLAKSEDLTGSILAELAVLEKSFRGEPDFLRLLQSHSLTKQERCHILDDSFRGEVHIYVLNFLKILTEKSHIRHFFDCCEAYRGQYNREHNILPVTAVTAIPLTSGQCQKLTDKLCAVTGKTIDLTNRVDPEVLGGVRLSYDGKQVEDTVLHRLDAIRSALKAETL